jgi:integrase
VEEVVATHRHDPASFGEDAGRSIGHGGGGRAFHNVPTRSLLIAQGAHVKSSSVRLGHSSIGVTMDVYGDLLPEVDDALLAGLRRDVRSPAPL